MEQKRAFVGDLYPGPSWKRRVKQMSDAQILAIYLREQKKKEQPKNDNEESGDDGIPF